MLFFGGFGSMFANVLIQCFVEKARPDVVLNIVNFTRDSLILENLPKDTFPSDHAAMAAAIATVTLVWGIKHKDKTFIWLSVPLIFFALIMWFGRISIGVHRPTDILVGTAIGIAVSLLLFEKHIYKFLRGNVFDKIIGVQEKVFKFFGV